MSEVERDPLERDEVESPHAVFLHLQRSEDATSVYLSPRDTKDEGLTFEAM